MSDSQRVAAGNERRKHERYRYQAEAFVRWGSYVYWGNLDEISLGGMRLHTMAPIRGGGRFTVQVRLPAACGAQMESPVFSAQLRWRRGSVLGLGFVGQQEGAMRLLRRFLRDYFFVGSRELNQYFEDLGSRLDERPLSSERGLDEMDTLVWARSG